MKSVRAILILMISVFLLSHCGQDSDTKKEDKGDPQKTPPAPEKPITGPVNLEGHECIAGVYQGEADLRYNSNSIFNWSSTNVTVSIAFQGNSALVKVLDEEDGDLLCTQYEGIALQKNEDGSASSIGASKITSSRTAGSANSSPTLAGSLLEIQVSKDCGFDIGSIKKDNDADSIDINNTSTESDLSSKSLEKVANQKADFMALLQECGGEGSFTIVLPQEEKEEEEAATEEETAAE